MKACIESRDKQIEELKEQVAELKAADAQKKIDALTKELAKAKKQLTALKGNAEEPQKANPAKNGKNKADPNAVTFDRTAHQKIKIPEGMKWEFAESPDEKPTGRMSAAYTLGPLPKGINDKDALRFVAKGELDKTFRGRKLTKTLATGKNRKFPGSEPEGTVTYYVFYLGSVKDQTVAIATSVGKNDKAKTFFDFASCPNECEKKLGSGKCHVLIVKITSNPNWGTKNYVTVAGKDIHQGFVRTECRKAEPGKTVLD